MIIKNLNCSRRENLPWMISCCRIMDDINCLKKMPSKEHYGLTALYLFIQQAEKLLEEDNET